MLKVFTLAAVAVDTPGVREQITSNPILAQSVIVVAALSNAGTVYVGDNSVSSTNGVELNPGDPWVATAAQLGKASDEFDISDIYIDASQAGDEVRIQYIKTR